MGQPVVRPAAAEPRGGLPATRIEAQTTAKVYTIGVLSAAAGPSPTYGAILTNALRDSGYRPGRVEQPTKFELVLNLTTAKALRLTIPQAVLVRADEVVQ